MSGVAANEGFPKSARLRHSRDFRFRPYRRFETDNFCFLYTSKDSSQGRLGVSISKKILKNASSRNRVRRLIKETFRKNRSKFNGLDINCVAARPLRQSWKQLKQRDVEREFDSFLKRQGLV